MRGDRIKLESSGSRISPLLLNSARNSAKTGDLLRGARGRTRPVYGAGRSGYFRKASEQQALSAKKDRTSSAEA
jgi:hypothetical protein